MRSEASGWKLPVNLAILLHVLILISGLVIPKYFEKTPLIKEFLTVDLVNISAPLPAPATQSVSKPQTQTIKPVSSKTKPAVPEKPAPIAPVIPEKIDQVSMPTPTKAISISPIKRKIKKKVQPDNSVADARKERETRLRNQQEFERQRQQLHQEAQRTKALAEAERAAADDAVKALRQMLLADAEVTASTSQTTPSPTRRTGGGSNDIVESQYQASIFNSLHQHWALPDIKPWDPDLIAVVVIHIAKDGRIITHDFEKRSGDRVFDQFVSRTIQEANPLPAIPAAMRKQQYSIGLRFKPGEIH